MPICEPDAENRQAIDMLFRLLDEHEEQVTEAYRLYDEVRRDVFAKTAGGAPEAIKAMRERAAGDELLEIAFQMVGLLAAFNLDLKRDGYEMEASALLQRLALPYLSATQPTGNA